MSEKIYGFVQRKIALLDEETSYSRAMCAKLRRAIGKSPGSVPEIWELTLSDMPEEWQSRYGKPGFAEKAVHTALTLYSLHRQGKGRSMSVGEKTADGKEDGDSFGAAVARLIERDDSRFEAVKRRFNAAATATEFTELAHHIRGLVQLLKSEDVVINYPRFACDLYFFQMDEHVDRVRLRWGEDFYRILDKKNKKGEEAK